MYCPDCSSPKLDWLKPGTKASDYKCPACGFWFQLKSKKSPIGQSITDGAYGAMMEAIREDRAPSHFFLHYDLTTWTVRNLLVVPYFAFPPSAIIKRNPTQPKGRSQPWIGCNFDLGRIPVDARIAIVKEKQITSPEEVREKFKRVKPLEEIKGSERGWLLEVLNVVHGLQKAEFSNDDIYAFERELGQLYPENKNVRAKIRQKLQELRDRHLLLHVRPGVWRLP